MGGFGNGVERRKGIKEMSRNEDVMQGTKPKKLANNTIEFLTSDNVRCIKYHYTIVVMEYPADHPQYPGYTIFDNGGFNTITTRERLNMNGRCFRFSSERGQAYVSRSTEQGRVEYAFDECISMRPDGTPDDGRPPRKPKKTRPSKYDSNCPRIAVHFVGDEKETVIYDPFFKPEKPFRKAQVIAKKRGVGIGRARIVPASDPHSWLDRRNS